MLQGGGELLLILLLLLFLFDACCYGARTAAPTSQTSGASAFRSPRRRLTFGDLHRAQQERQRHQEREERRQQAERAAKRGGQRQSRLPRNNGVFVIVFVPFAVAVTLCSCWLLVESVGFLSLVGAAWRLGWVLTFWGLSGFIYAHGRDHARASPLGTSGNPTGARLAR